VPRGWLGVSNYISDEKYDLAMKLFEQGYSIRQVMRRVKIAKQTANTIRQAINWLREEKGLPQLSCKMGYWTHRKHDRGRR